MGRFSIRMLVQFMAGSLLLLLMVSAAIAVLSKQALSTDVHHGKIVMQQSTALLELRNIVNLSRVDALKAARGDGAAFTRLGGHLSEANGIVENARGVFLPEKFPEFGQSAPFEMMLAAREDTTALAAGLEALRSLPPDILAGEIEQQILPVLEKHATTLQLESEIIAAQFDEVRVATLERMSQGLVVQLAMAALAIVVGLVVSVVVARALAKPIASSAEAVRRLAQEDYQSEISGTDRRDEIGDIAQNLVSLRDRLALAEAANSKERAASEKRMELFDLLGHAMHDLADGKTQIALDGSQFSELGQDYVALCENFNSLSDTLSALVVAIGASSKSVAENAADLSSMSEDLSRRAETQAATLEETAAAIEELSQSVNQAAERAISADEKVVENRRQAEEGREVMDRALKAMQSIARSSERINQILAVIDDIAFQTNLLALNAGVEAARAGDTGKGFSVVASEVRSLAQRAAESAREIKDLVTQSGKEVEEGGILVQETSEKLGMIVDNVAAVSSLVAEIAASTKSQASGVQEINTGMSELDSVTQKNAAMVLEASAASSGLNAEAKKLESHLAQFSGSPQRDHNHAVTAEEAVIPAKEQEPAEPASSGPVEKWDIADTAVPPSPTGKIAVGSDDIWEEF